MAMSATNEKTATDARTAPVAVWQILEKLKGQDLIDWRMADVKGRASIAERNLDIGFPFGWYPVMLASDLAVGEVKPLRYFSTDLAIWRGEDGQVRMVDAYCKHLGAHMGHRSLPRALPCGRRWHNRLRVRNKYLGCPACSQPPDRVVWLSLGHCLWASRPAGSANSQVVRPWLQTGNSFDLAPDRVPGAFRLRPPLQPVAHNVRLPDNPPPIRAPAGTNP